MQCVSSNDVRSWARCSTAFRRGGHAEITRFPVRAILRSYLELSCDLRIAQNQAGPTTVRRDLHHDVSPPLLEMMRNAPAQPYQQHEAEPRRAIPLPKGLSSLEEDPLIQPATSGFSPQIGLSFEGIGDGQYGFTVEYAPPDTNGAVGATQYVQWVNTYFAIFDKRSGALLAGPMPGNILWSGFGGGCQSNNDGDPIVLYDKAANRWVMSQFSVSTTPLPAMRGCIGHVRRHRRVASLLVPVHRLR